MPQSNFATLTSYEFPKTLRIVFFYYKLQIRLNNLYRIESIRIIEEGKVTYSQAAPQKLEVRIEWVLLDDVVTPTEQLSVIPRGIGAILEKLFTDL